jgi:hypothetical protein
MATDPLSLSHVNAKLEDLLPTIIGGICLQKFSLMLSAYIASPASSGDKDLYPAWLVQFNKTPAEVTMALAADLTDQENFQIRAIQVPGADAATLSSAFADVARKAGWPVVSLPNPASTGQTILAITNPADGHVGDVYAKGDVLYTIITNDYNLLLQALIHLVTES